MGKVKVKFLKHVMEWAPGDIVELDEEMANTVCKVSHHNDGHGIQEYVKAMRLSDVEKLDKVEVDVSKMTAGEMAKLGKKNIVHTPKDANFEKRLEDIRKADAEPMEEKPVKGKKAKEQKESPKEE